MANTFELIESYTVSGTASSIDFNSIPSTYTDLVVVASLRDSFASNALDHWIRFNNNTSNYTWRKVQGAGSGTPTSSTSAVDPYMVLAVSPGSTTTSNTFSNSYCYIPNYAGSTYKSISVDAVGENNGTQAFAVLSAGLWANTAAITSVNLIPYSGSTFANNSTAYLYGVKNV